MSSVATKDDVRFVGIARNLFAEFGKKIDGIRAELDDFYTRRRRLTDQIQSRATEEDTRFLDYRIQSQLRDFHRLEPELLSVARRVSQRLEHAGMDEVSFLELKPRLADFERNIIRTVEFLAFISERFVACGVDDSDEIKKWRSRGVFATSPPARQPS